MAYNSIGARTNNQGRLFAETLLKWYKANKRSYAWRRRTNPYKVLVSEIMLQQTNADRVAGVYYDFICQYPNPRTLAQADLRTISIILKPIGLRYRAARLKRIAEALMAEYCGKVPCSEEALLALPGVGKYVTNAVMCFAYRKRVPLVDVNIIRVYERAFGYHSKKYRPREDSEVWEFANRMLPKASFKEYNLALLDFSAAVCTPKNPRCVKCPVNDVCLDYAKGSQKNAT
jgi:A/G-specific adenine glycosylase